MAAEFSKIYVLFKTHLDVGFTDLARNVVRQYLNSYIPNAIATAKMLREKGGAARFVWTTGSWLIQECLERGSEATRSALEEAIRAGDIRWHGLPFTTHTEIMDVPLFRYGLSLSQGLDARFGRKTIAAKMTDVPGHTKAMIPLLCEAGIEFLHIGVNESCTMPNLPPIFRWKNGKDAITIMYSQSYGDFAPIGNSGAALYFAHTGDNTGGQSAKQVEKLFEKLRAEHPNTEIVAADLNDVANEAKKIADTLPVITQEIGDTWIHGVGSDPQRMAMYKAMLRFRDSLEDESERNKLNHGLLMIPEHTWGVDEKTYLKDHKHFARAEFDKLRGTKQNYKMMEASWEEQRAYITGAVQSLSPANREGALSRLRDLGRTPSNLADAQRVKPYEMLEINGYTVQINRRGIIKYLKQGDTLLADETHILGRILYEQFCKEDYDRFFGQYNILPVEWAIEDFQKLGMERGIDRYRQYKPNLTELYQKGNRLIALLEFPEEAYRNYGCPRTAELVMLFEKTQLSLDFRYFDKPANRMAEAMWLLMNPIASNPRVRKLGEAIDPADVVENGNRKLFGTDYGVVYDNCSVGALDSALLAFETPSLLDFNNKQPDPAKGVWFNLFNNVWGTNFCMWHSGAMHYRFVLRLNPALE